MIVLASVLQLQIMGEKKEETYLYVLVLVFFSQIQNNTVYINYSTFEKNVGNHTECLVLFVIASTKICALESRL